MEASRHANLVCNQLVMLCSTSFKRYYEDIDIGYIYNSITQNEQFLDQDATALLKLIERRPKAIGSVLSELDIAISTDSNGNETSSTLELLKALESDGYILIGDSEIELNAKDPKFHYGIRSKESTPTNSVKGYLPSTSAADGIAEHFEGHPRILFFQLDVTSKCNEKCVHCYLPPDWFEFNDLDTKLGLKVLDELRNEGTLTICFSGGEAFLHKEFDKLLYRARENDLVIKINTNATHISDYYVEVLKEVQPEKVQISLYSMTPDVHDKITTVRGSHKRTMDGITRLMEANICISISCPVMKGNKHCYKDVIRWGEQQGVQVRTDFMLFGCTDFDQTNLSNRLSIEDVEDLIQDAIKYDSTYRAKVEKEESVLNPLDLVQKPLCGAGINSLSMDVKGDSYFCPVFRPIELGNAKQDKLRDIWLQSRPLLELRKVTWGDFPGCMKCEAFNYCNMCFARNANESDGSHLKVNKNCCEISFLNKRLVEEYRESAGTHNHSSDTVSFKVIFNPSSQPSAETQVRESS
jgi:radical SAM protein with 4Fe4S-binding SPASM domain